MKRFVEFSLHEYMDEHPTQQVRIMEGDTLEAIESSSKEYASQISKLYSGGPTSFVKVWEFPEANDWYIKIHKELGPSDNWSDEDIEWDTFVKKELAECYPENKIFIGVVPY